MDSSQTAIYLFCFAKEALLPDLKTIEMESDEGPGLSSLSVEGIAVVYGFVRIEDFTGPGSEERLLDLEWVGPRAVFHANVIETIARHSPVFPAPFGTIYLSEKNLRDYLSSHIHTVSRFLDSVSDKNEWAVKAFINPEGSEKAAREMLLGEGGELPSTPGARYLQQRRITQTAAGKFQIRLGKILAEARQELARIASELRVRNPLPESGLDEPAEMVANWAFLVPKSEERRIIAIVRHLNDLHRDRGIFFRISGPWPPFSFTPPLKGGADA